MSLNNNIKNAFTVVHKTVESAKKLMEYCDRVAEENGYMPVTNKFLRRKSDSDVDGLVLNMAIKLYQRSSDGEIMANGWRNGPIYALELNFKDEPCYYLSMFEYEDMIDWSRGISPASWWAFYFPTDSSDNRHEISDLDSIYKISKPKDGYKSTYWGLNKVTFRTGDITEIKTNNVNDLIFKEFDVLREKANYNKNQK